MSHEVCCGNCRTKTGIKWICAWMWIAAIGNFLNGVIFLPVAIPNLVVAIIISVALRDSTLEKRKCAYIAMVITTAINTIGWIFVLFAMFVVSGQNTGVPIFFEIAFRVWFCFCLKTWYEKKRDKTSKEKEVVQVVMVPVPGQVQIVQGQVPMQQMQVQNPQMQQPMQVQNPQMQQPTMPNPYVQPQAIENPQMQQPAMPNPYVQQQQQQQQVSAGLPVEVQQQPPSNPNQGQITYTYDAKI